MQQDATTDEAAPESEEPVDATRNTRIADVIADPVLCCVMSRRTFAVLGLGAIASFVTLQACDTRNHGDPGTYAPPTADAEGTEDEAAEPGLEDAAKRGS